ncbi:MAG TPA: hypothetical protein VIM56_08010 [Rhizomicrobium sp.]
MKMAMTVRRENNRQPWIQTRIAVIVFFVGLAVLWGGISLLFYLEIP